jgi:RNA polymerase sigma-70 factor (ECF subfamily)
MGHEASDTEELLERAKRGDESARDRLVASHRARLRRMVAVRLDRRLAARVDPSDVVQEVLIDASGKLDEFLRERPLPFYAWLRQFAWNRLVDLHRRHVKSRRRSVAREERSVPDLPDESTLLLVERLLDNGTSPSRRLIRAEQREELRSALTALPARDREVLVMRHLEQMEIGEIAAVLEITEGAVKARILRALLRLRGLLEGQS